MSCSWCASVLVCTVYSYCASCPVLGGDKLLLLASSSFIADLFQVFVHYVHVCGLC